MHLIKIIILLFFIVSNSTFSQETFSKYFDINVDNDVGWKIIKANDKYFVLSGSFCHQNTIPCSGLLCFDKHWNLVWKRELDSLPAHFMDCITTDNDHLYLCTTTARNAGYDFILLKLDLDGNLINSKYYGNYTVQVIPYTINYYNNILYLNISFWHGPSTGGYDSTQVWYLNTNFDLLYSFTDSDKKRTENMIGFLPTKDSNFIGFKSVEKFFQTTEGIVKKFDPNGKLIWRSTINGESKYPLYYSLQKIRPTNDGGSVGIWNQTYEGINNDTFPEQPILFKLNSNGKEEWSHTFFSKRRKYFYSLFETSTGDVIGVGIDENPGKTSRYKSNGWVVKFSKYGELLWEYSYIDSSTINGYSHFYDGIETEDENLVFCGTIRPKRDSGSILHHDVWIVKTDKHGCLISTCDSVQITTKIVEFDEPKEYKFTYSNPILNECYISSDQDIVRAKVKILTIGGKIVFIQKNVKFPININLENINSGMYIISIFSENNELLKSSKLIKF